MTPTNQKGTREDAVVRRAQILDEAIRLIGRIGSRGFTIQGLASQCGISNAGLLYYFGSKDGLILALIDEIERREEEIVSPLVATAQAELGKSDRAYEAMLRLLRRIAERYCEDPELGRFVIILQTEAMDTHHAAHAWFQARAQEAEDLFVQLVSPWSPVPAQTARIVYALMFGLARRWFDAPTAFDLGSTFEEAIRSLIPDRGRDQASGS